MNCKPGDLAVFVRSHAGNEGHIVRCLRLAEASDFTAWRVFAGPSTGQVWLIEGLVRVNPSGRKAPFAQDKNLRPIRDPGDDATDETLEWLDVPGREPVHIETKERA